MIHEQALFERFHEALDVEPRPGAYERLRFSLSQQHPAARKRPAFRVRSPKMGLRLAAVLAAIAIVAVAVAAIMAAHRSSIGIVPAGPDKNTQAYRAMQRADYTAMSNSTSDACHTIQDTTCPAAINRVLPALERWLTDMNSFHTPTQYAALDGQLRAHVAEVIVELNAAIVFQRQGNANGFTTAMNAAVYERAWVDPATLTLEGTYPRVTSSYSDAVNQARHGLGACVNGSPGPADIACSNLSSATACLGSMQDCENSINEAETQLEPFLVALTQNAAPAALSAKNAQLEADLAQADDALLAMTDELLKGDSGKEVNARSSYASAIDAAYSAATLIG